MCKNKQICGGVLSIHTLRDSVTPLELVCQTVPVRVLESVYTIRVARARKRVSCQGALGWGASRPFIGTSRPYIAGRGAVHTHTHTHKNTHTQTHTHTHTRTHTHTHTHRRKYFLSFPLPLGSFDHYHVCVCVCVCVCFRERYYISSGHNEERSHEIAGWSSDRRSELLFTCSCRLGREHTERPRLVHR
jgi:hypothetical protein